MSDTWGSDLSFGATNAGQTAEPMQGAEVPPAAAPSFGTAIKNILPGPQYRAPDPKATALDQTADILQQRVERANQIATNPLLQIFNPEGVSAARNFVPQATEKLQQIKVQKAQMQANRTEAETMGLAPGEVPDEATREVRIQVAQQKALKGDLRSWKGMMSASEESRKAAEAIQDQVFEVAGTHLNGESD